MCVCVGIQVYVHVNKKNINVHTYPVAELLETADLLHILEALKVKR